MTELTVPYEEPIGNLRGIAGRALEIVRAEFLRLLLIIVVLIVIPVLIWRGLMPILFNPEGVSFGGGALAFLGDAWWNIGARSAFNIIASLFINAAMISLIPGMFTVFTISRLHGEKVSTGEALRLVWGQRGWLLWIAFALMATLYIALTVFSFLGTFIIIGIFGTPLTLLFLGSFVPMMGSVLLLERGAFSRLMMRSYHLGKTQIWKTLRILLSTGLLIWFIGWLTNQIVPESSVILRDAIWLLNNYALWGFAFIMFAIMYFEARLESDSDEVTALVLQGDSPAPDEPFYSRKDFNLTVRIMAAVGTLLVLITLIWAIVTIAYVVINLEDINAGIEAVTEQIIVVIDKAQPVFRLVDTLQNPELFSNLGSVVDQVGTIVGGEDAAELQTAIQNVLNENSLDTLQTLVDPANAEALREALGTQINTDNLQQLDGAVDTLLEPENIQAIQRSLEAVLGGAALLSR